jgi:hypothetical protein
LGETEPSALLGEYVYIARAVASANEAELSRLVRSVAEARRGATRPVVCLLLVVAETELPSALGRQALQRTLVILANYCESVAFVVSGSGVERSLLRTLLRGVVSASGQATKVRVVEDVEGLARASSDPGLASATLARLVADAALPALALQPSTSV